MIKLKLKNAERYACPAIGENVILKGQTVTVSEEVAKMLLEDIRVDGLNNEHQVWEDVTGSPDEEEQEEGSGDGDGDGDDAGGDGAGAGKPVRAARTASAAKKKSG